jgi:signal transduction histidine kinase
MIGKMLDRSGPAVRVAILATALVGAVYVVAAVVLYFVAVGRLTSQADARLADSIAMARANPSAATRVNAPAVDPDGDNDMDTDPDQVPIYLWSVSPSGAAAGNLGKSGTIAAHTPGAPALPAGLAVGLVSSAARTGAAGTSPAGMAPVGTAFTTQLGAAGSYRVLATKTSDGVLVAGLSRAGDLHTLNLVLDAELVGGPLVMLAMFGGSLIVGLRALAPVEQARRRQLEFTADASHELRTPLSVIRAEVDVALSDSARSAADYRDSLVRVQSESERLRRLVDDLLWLARFDSRPPPPSDEPVDLGILAQTCADRFRAVGPAIAADIDPEPALISAPPEWIDRLAGVLMDNACRYAGPDGQVKISVRTQGRLSLTVEDSGPGIPEADRSRLFDRFQRLEENGPGAGLGLAIGDSIVTSTGGHWRIGTSSLGGAVMEVSWRHPYRSGSQRAGAAPMHGVLHMRVCRRTASDSL